MMEIVTLAGYEATWLPGVIVIGAFVLIVAFVLAAAHWGDAVLAFLVTFGLGAVLVATTALTYSTISFDTQWRQMDDWLESQGYTIIASGPEFAVIDEDGQYFEGQFLATDEADKYRVVIYGLEDE